ncbi:MAG: HAD family hydrolase [Candidatus Symbiothrix sp.]|jgi:putative hydrolase of the HAD superfamily|nr:HAD family hydrolase [Candidatus Symbiothrix sp.]
MLYRYKIKGIIFDYGATIDTNGMHWAEVLWDAYVKNGVPVDKSQFREAYVYAERYLALHPVIRPWFTFKDVLLSKTEIQLKWLVEQFFLPKDTDSLAYSLAISNQCYNFATVVLEKARPVLKKLASLYPLALVSNFYGNIETVLKDFDLSVYFTDIIESAAVGIRKPDPAIFALGAKVLKLNPEEIVVIGDSYKKDILPAASIGCQTIWLRGVGWESDNSPGESASAVIDDFGTLWEIFA